MLLSGGGEDGALGTIDVEDLRQYVRYSGGYREDSTTVKLFWKVCITDIISSFYLLLHCL